MSVIAMLAILWWGIIGFLGFCLAIWGVIQSCKDGHWMSDRQAGLANLKHRDRWLLEFFGEAGRERWLANERRRHLSEGNWEYATQDARELAKRAKRDAKIKRQRDGELAKDRYAFSKPRRTADGRCVGMVRDPSRSLSEYSWNPPWGDDWREYHVVRVPRACDWLAAGFWDPFVYKGSTIDPVAMVHQEMVMGYQTRDGAPNSSPFDNDGASLDRAMKEAKEIEAAGGTRARGIGMPGENGGRPRTYWAGISKQPYVPNTGRGLGRRIPC